MQGLLSTIAQFKKKMLSKGNGWRGGWRGWSGWRRPNDGKVSPLLHQVHSNIHYILPSISANFPSQHNHYQCYHDQSDDDDETVRYKNHDNARRVEFPLLTSVHHKRNLLQVTIVILIDIIFIWVIIIIAVISIIVVIIIIIVIIVTFHLNISKILLKASLIGDMGNTVLKKGNTVDTQVETHDNDHDENYDEN